MSRFRKNPVVIEARQIKMGRWSALAEWCGGEIVKDIESDGKNYTYDHIRIDTLEGVMKANKYDWIIKGVKGEFYPCKPDIFELTYEAVTDKPICSICNTDVDDGEGVAGMMGMVPFVFCPTCRAGVWEWSQQQWSGHD